MKISDTGPIKPSAVNLKRAKQAGTTGVDFASLLDTAGGAGPAAPTEAAEEVASAGLLGFQEISDEELRRHKAIRQGEDMLTSLERLRSALLAGSISGDVLRELEGRLARQREQVSDPKLVELIDDIELRVAVELAKLEMAQKLADGDYV